MGYQMFCIFYLNFIHIRNVKFLCLKNTQEMDVHCPGEVKDSLYEECFKYVLETEGWVYPGTVKEALTLYQHIIKLQNE